MRLQVLKLHSNSLFAVEYFVLVSTCIQVLLVVLSFFGYIDIPFNWFNKLSGLDVGTTGMTRAAVSFFNGNYLSSIVTNPFLFPFCFLIATANLKSLSNIYKRKNKSLNDIGIATLIVIASATVYRNLLFKQICFYIL